MKAEEFAKSTSTFFLDVWQVDIFHRSTIEKEWQHRRKLILNNDSLTEEMRNGLTDSFFQSYIDSNKVIELAERMISLEGTVKK